MAGLGSSALLLLLLPSSPPFLLSPHHPPHHLRHRVILLHKHVPHGQRPGQDAGLLPCHTEAGILDGGLNHGCVQSICLGPAGLDGR